MKIEFVVDGLDEDKFDLVNAALIFLAEESATGNPGEKFCCATIDFEDYGLSISGENLVDLNYLHALVNQIFEKANVSEFEIRFNCSSDKESNEMQELKSKKLLFLDGKYILNVTPKIKIGRAEKEVNSWMYLAQTLISVINIRNMNFDNETFYATNRDNLQEILDDHFINFFDLQALCVIAQRCLPCKFFSLPGPCCWLDINVYLNNILQGIDVKNSMSLLVKAYEDFSNNGDNNSEQTEVADYLIDDNLSDTNTEELIKDKPNYIDEAKDRLKGYIARASNDPYLKEGRGLGFWGIFFKKSMLANRQNNISLAQALLKSIEDGELSTISRIFSRENIHELKKSTGSLLRSNELKNIIEDSRNFENKGNSLS